MTGCERLSDRMPRVALGQDGWTADEAAHLEACPDCRAEWALVGAAGRLGARAPTVSDPAAIAALVLRRLAQEPAARAPGRLIPWAGGLAAAAAILALVWAGGRDAGSGGEPVATGSPVAAVEQLSAAQVDSLLDRDDVPLAGWSMLETPTLGDLDEAELERVLRTWEG